MGFKLIQIEKAGERLEEWGTIVVRLSTTRSFILDEILR